MNLQRTKLFEKAPGMKSLVNSSNMATKSRAAIIPLVYHFIQVKTQIIRCF